MTACTAGQPPYVASSQGYTYTGQTELEACRAWALDFYGTNSNPQNADIVDGRCHHYPGGIFGHVYADLATVCTSGVEPVDDPLMTVCNGACTVTHVVTIDFPLLQMDLGAAASIAGAVLAVWVVGWAFRTFIKLLNIDGKTSTSESE